MWYRKDGEQLGYYPLSNWLKHISTKPNPLKVLQDHHHELYQHLHQPTTVETRAVVLTVTIKAVVKTRKKYIP